MYISCATATYVHRCNVAKYTRKTTGNEQLTKTTLEPHGCGVGKQFNMTPTSNTQHITYKGKFVAAAAPHYKTSTNYERITHCPLGLI